MYSYSCRWHRPDQFCTAIGYTTIYNVKSIVVDQSNLTNGKSLLGKYFVVLCASFECFECAHLNWSKTDWTDYAMVYLQLHASIKSGTVPSGLPKSQNVDWNTYLLMQLS